ncbi:MAG: RsmB/NOP family class I SAM-dependent RNA methyltransferase [Aurantimonas endophytica]|nr:RsmB/NOP family class I SAM-dependent RNA methyltransferase [Aurantimonas endophytica]MCO6405564.1 methyltransferase [Aurantimonas endophytica]
MRLGGRMAASIEVLADIETRRRPVGDALKDWGLSHRFAGSGDRAAIGNIVYDVLRRKRSLAWRLDDPSPRALVFGAVLDSSGLDEKGLALALEGDRFAPEMISADDLAGYRTREIAQAPDAVRADVPDWIGPHLAEAFGEDWVEEAAALGERPPLDMRANTLRADRDKVARALEPFAPQPSPIAPQGLRIAPIAGDGRHPNVQVEAGFQKGWFEIQDEGSQIVAALTGVAPGEQVLDYCAGAGGKTLALAAAMENTGQIHAYDSDRQRLAPIHERLKRAEVRNVQVHAPRDDLSEHRGRMDLVLVDAPCTGTGTWRRRPDAKWRLSEQALERRVVEQREALAGAAAFVKPGGRLAYVTCSLLPAENEAQVEAFLTAQPDFALLDVAATWATVFPEAPPAFLSRPHKEGTTLTLTPRTSGTDGFFLALFTRR